MNETRYIPHVDKTMEYLDVITYMEDILGSEFPSTEYTVEYMMLSILDNPKCHANMIIDNMLRSDTLNYLKEYYQDKIKATQKGQITKEKKNRRYNEELVNVIHKAYEEFELISSPKIGTEHILLAILNPLNNCSLLKKLCELGLSYSFILTKSASFIDKKYMEKRNNMWVAPHTPTPNKNNKIPLKSEINFTGKVSNNNTPFIDKYTVNLHEEIQNNKYDKLVGREEILNKIVKVLSRRKKNNVILVGKPGTGKTSLGVGLAEMINLGNVPSILEEKQVIMLDSTALVSGTHLRGMFEERVDGLFKELKANPNYILFIDDMQNVIRNNGKDKDSDLSDLLGKILSGGDVRVIGTISFKDYRNGVENNSVLSTKLQKIVVEPSSTEETFKILQANKHYYEDFHHVKFSDECLYKAIKLAKRYITNNNLPDSAIDIIDLTGASVSLNNKQSTSLKKLKSQLQAFNEEKKEAMSRGDFEELDNLIKKENVIEKEICDINKKINNDDSTWIKVSEDNISDTVSSITTIPVSKLTSSNKDIILNIDKILKETVIGQDDAINEIAKAIKRSRTGFSDNNKCTVLLMHGQSGTGKTLIAKQLAKNVYGDEKALVRFDMSEYQDKTSVNKLLGSSAGYVGYDNGGLLTEAIKNKPYCVLLFDEIEKADESIYNVFLQLFDEGRLTDNNGTTVNFKNVIVIMTSNIGAKQVSELGTGVGFQSNVEDNKKAIIKKALKNKFNPEFLNRIDKIIHFNTLTDDNLKNISVLEMKKIANRVKENNVTLEYGDDVIEYIYTKAIKEKEYGARPIMRIIQDDISDKVVDLVLSSDKKKNKYHISVNDNDEIVVEKVKK